jgi:hypothetical protein
MASCPQGVDNPQRQVAFNRHKKQLLKKAMELSVLCECSVALIVFGPDGKMVQFSSAEDLNVVLEKFQQARQQPHEKYTNEDVSRRGGDCRTHRRVISMLTC